MTANTDPTVPPLKVVIPDSLVQQYYDPVEVADMFRVKVRTVTNWLTDPNHPLWGIKLTVNRWRIPHSSLVAFLQKAYGNESK